MTDYVAGSLSALFGKKPAGNDAAAVKLTRVKQMYEEFEPRKAPKEIGRKADDSQKNSKRKREAADEDADVHSSKRGRSVYRLPRTKPAKDSAGEGQEAAAVESGNFGNRDAALLRISRKNKAGAVPVKREQTKQKKTGKPDKDEVHKGDGNAKGDNAEVDGKREFRYYEDDPTYIARTIFVKNLPPKTQRKQMKNLFGKCGDILFVRFANAIPKKASIPADSALKKRSLIKEGTTICAYVVFAEVSAVEAALKLNGVDFNGHHLRVDKRQASSVPPKRSVFCGNLAFDTTDDDLWEFFAEAGEIDYVRVVRDSLSGEGKGIAFVVFKDSAAALLALEFSGRDFNGRQIRVTAIEKKSGGASGMGPTPRNVQVSGSKERINKKKLEKKALQQERKLKGPKQGIGMGKQKREKIKKAIKREKMTKLKKNFAKKLQGLN